MKFLVCTVGGSPRPVIDTCKLHQDAFIYFIGSRGNDPNTASALTIDGPYERSETINCQKCGKYTAKYPALGIARIAGVSSDRYAVFKVEPDSIESTYGECEKITADMVRRAAGSSFEVIADYTGGTKSMSAGLVLFALSQDPPWKLMIQTLSGRPDLVKVTSGNVGRIQKVASIRFQDVTKRCRALIDGMNYQQAAGMLEQFLITISIDEQQREEAESMVRECRMQMAWDRFSHAEALEIARTDSRLKAAYEGKLRKLAGAAAAIGTAEPWPRKNRSPYALVGDLIRIAGACAKTARYDDAAGRLYRATELLAQVHLRRCYGILTGNVDEKAVPEVTREWLKEYRDKDGAVRIGLFAAYKLLDDLRDPLGAYARETGNQLRGFIDKRNNSLYAHGIVPVDKALWDDFGTFWTQWLAEALKKAEIAE